MVDTPDSAGPVMAAEDMVAVKADCLGFLAGLCFLVGQPAREDFAPSMALLPLPVGDARFRIGGHSNSTCHALLSPTLVSVLMLADYTPLRSATGCAARRQRTRGATARSVAPSRFRVPRHALSTAQHPHIHPRPPNPFRPHALVK